MQPYSNSKADYALHTMARISGPVLPIQITAQNLFSRVNYSDLNGAGPR